MVWHPGTGLGLAKIVVVKRRYVCLSHKYAHTYRYQSWYEVTIFGDPQLLGRTHHNYRRLLLAYIQSCTGTHSSPWPFPSVPAKKIFPLLLVPMSIHLYVLLIIIIFVIIQLTRRWMSTNRRPGYESCMLLHCHMNGIRNKLLVDSLATGGIAALQWNVSPFPHFFYISVRFPNICFQFHPTVFPRNPRDPVIRVPVLFSAIVSFNVSRVTPKIHM